MPLPDHGPPLPPKPRRSDKSKSKPSRRRVRSEQPSAAGPPTTNAELIAAGSRRLDVIDQMDISGIVGASMFHHDSPYDACSPYKNRSGAAAPMRAFAADDPASGSSAAPARLGPAPDSAPSLRNPPHLSMDVEDSAGYFSTPLAEMWGQSSEPWQEFSATQEQQHPRRAGYGAYRESLTDYPDMETILRGGTRVSEADAPPAEPAPAEPAPEMPQSSMKRSKSLAQRLRRLRVGPEEAAGGAERPAYSAQGATRSMSTDYMRPSYGDAAGAAPRDSRAARMSERTPASAMLMSEPAEAQPAAGPAQPGLSRSKTFFGRLRSLRK